MTTRLRTGMTVLFRRLAPSNAPDAPADVALLDRFVTHRDETAFAEIVRRHGPMVLSVCQRRLGAGPDADDAHQVAFLALARDAGKVGRESLAGWLYRVAYLTALKMSGRVHRRKPEPLTTDLVAAMTPEPDAGLQAVLDEELTSLPDKFRGVAVLCLIEGLTNAAAAERLGIPKGTVDSRLSGAKAKLRDRLLRRGVSAAALVSLETVLSAGTATAAGRSAALAADLIPLALSYAAGCPLPGSEHLTTTANGVTPMTAISSKWLAVAALTAGLLGTAGFGVYQATAADDKKAEQKKADPPKPPADRPPVIGKLESTPAAGVKTADDVMKALAGVADLPEMMSFEEFADLLGTVHGLPVRLDTPAFARRGITPDTLNQLRERQLRLRSVRNLPLSDVLREVMGQMTTEAVENAQTLRLSYRIKGNQLLVVPEYVPPTTPGAGLPGEEKTPRVTPDQLAEAIYGEPVTVRYKNKPLTAVIEDLEERTGANIVVNGRAFPDFSPDQPITANFNDTRLLTVLKIVGNMCNMKPVVIDNVYYLTDENSAVRLQAEADRDLYGDPKPVTPTVAPVKPAKPGEKK
ncbi:MAG: sigma-70 family RNA polymerase sigma factor [Gemmataceae bacterium]